MKVETDKIIFGEQLFQRDSLGQKMLLRYHSYKPTPVFLSVHDISTY